MLRMNTQIGFNPLRKHIPVQTIRTQTHIYTAGIHGEIVCWLSTYEPLYQIIPSINADTDKLVAFTLAPLRLISSQQKSMKIITIHQDGRLRIFDANDGVCLNISPHNVFPQKILGIVENSEESRFLLCYGKQKIYIFDSWLMRTIDTLELAIETFSIFVKGKVNNQVQLEMMDKQQKCYKFDLSKLLSQSHLDVGSYVSNAEKAFDFLESSILQMKQGKTISSYKKIHEKPFTEEQKNIQKKIEELKENNIWEDIFDRKSLVMPHIKELIESKEIPVISNLYFIKGTKLWYFFGTSSGKIFGFPAVSKLNQHVVVIIEENNYGPVSYIEFLDNLLIISWKGGLMNVYTVDNLQFTINEHLKKKQDKDVCYVYPKNNKIFQKRMSAEIKYKLDIYSPGRGKVGLQLFAFQLINNEVFIFDTIHRRCINFRGLPEDSRIYTVLDCQDYYGIAHKKGVDMYSADRFERRISYDSWIWTDFQFCDRVSWNQDYNDVGLRNEGDRNDYSKIDGMKMLNFCDRFYWKKLDFYSLSSDLYYETFGLVEDEEISNEMYSTFHFIQKTYTEKIIHSTCSENATSVLKMKSLNRRRDHWENTSFLLSLNLNRQLEIINEENTQFQEILDKNFTMFSLFLWDDNFIPFLTQSYANCAKKFIFNRRYCEQGIGKSFTIYFDNHSQHELSSNSLTLSALSSTALLQILASKDIQLTDSMVQTVQFFTTKRNRQKCRINPEMLSKMCLSESSFVLKGCINLLMSAALTEKIPLHPIYEYFTLNLKNIQETKNKQLNQTQTIWLVYLGVGLIYSDQTFDKDHLKILIARLWSSIDMKNFQLHADLVIVVLKILNEGIKKWKGLISSGLVLRLFADLFMIFFLYDGLNVVSHDDKKFDFRFENVHQNQAKKIKQQIVKSIVYLSKQFGNQFLQVLRTQALNQKPHPSYPSSVVEILRQFIKTQKPTTNLVFYIQLLLQCLSPITPNLRKNIQKNVLNTLQIMCSYETISFNNTSQKLSVRTDTNIYIYCLRTSTKWRTITVKDELPPEKSILKMSPKGTYIALLSDKLKIWRLSSGFWSGVLGAFSQGWTFEASGKALKWDQSEASITVINENPSLNACYKL